MTRYDIIPASFKEVHAINDDMRQADYEELWATNHEDPASSVIAAFLTSKDLCYVGTADTKPVCIFGVKPPTLLGNVAVPWMIGTTKLKLHSRVFLRESLKVVRKFSEHFEYMENFVDARNTVAIRWLQWVGFSVYYPEAYGAEGLPFHRFDMRSENVRTS